MLAHRDSKIWPWILWDFGSGVIALARPRSNCTVNYRPFSRQRGRIVAKRRKCQTKEEEQDKIWSRIPKGGPIPRRTGRLTVSRKKNSNSKNERLLCLIFGFTHQNDTIRFKCGITLDSLFTPNWSITNVSDDEYIYSDDVIKYKNKNVIKTGGENWRKSSYFNVSLCLINEAQCHEGIWENGGITLPFLTSTLDGSEQSASRPSRFTLWKMVRGTH
jgi:hypothetical protein